MKTAMVTKKLTLVSVLVLLATGIFSFPVSAQESDTLKKPRKVVKVKMKVEGDEESISIDTTFVLDDFIDREAFRKSMAAFRDQMRLMEKDFGKMEVEFRDWEKELGDMEICLKRLPGDRRELSRIMRYCRPPHMPPGMECCPGWRSGSPGHPWICMDDEKEIRSLLPGKGETLSDVLGDIPMRAVKSYKIRETRDGKRIIIVVDDDYLMQGPGKVMILRTPHPSRMQMEKPEIRKEVIIETEPAEEPEEE